MDDFGDFGEPQQVSEVPGSAEGNEEDRSTEAASKGEDNTSADGGFGDFEDADFGHFESPGVQKGDQTPTNVHTSEVIDKNEGFGVFSSIGKTQTEERKNLDMHANGTFDPTGSALQNTLEVRYLERAASLFKQIFKFEEIETFGDDDSTISNDKTIKTCSCLQFKGSKGDSESSQHTSSEVARNQTKINTNSKESEDLEGIEESNDEGGRKHDSESSQHTSSEIEVTQTELKANSEKSDDVKDIGDSKEEEVGQNNEEEVGQIEENEDGFESSQHRSSEVEVKQTEEKISNEESDDLRDTDERNDEEVGQIEGNEDGSESSQQRSSEVARHQTEVKVSSEESDDEKDIDERYHDEEGVNQHKNNEHGEETIVDGNQPCSTMIPITIKDILVSFQSNRYFTPISLLLTLEYFFRCHFHYQIMRQMMTWL